MGALLSLCLSFVFRRPDAPAKRTTGRVFSSSVGAGSSHFPGVFSKKKLAKNLAGIKD